MNDRPFHFTSTRQFQLWRYTVSHSQLLLRSNKGDDYSTRLEVLFKGVDWMSLPTILDGLEIGECGPDSLPTIKETCFVPNASHHRCFQVSTSVERGFVVASSVFVAEDDGDYSTPSTLYVDGIR